MKEEESLSDKRIGNNCSRPNCTYCKKFVYWEKDIKETIQVLKEEFNVNYTWEMVMELIDKLFGDKLI